MTFTCPRSEEHKNFKRLVQVEGPTFAVIDRHGDPVTFEDCGEFRVVRSTSHIRCADCGSQPRVTVI